MKWYRVLFAAYLLAPSTALCGITVPAKVQVGEQLVAAVDAVVPPGATSDVTWSIECESGCTATWATLEDGKSIGVWSTGGKLKIRYKGFWLLLEPVTFVDGNGKEITIQSYRGHGSIDEVAVVEVIGGSPGPPPGPNPPVPGQKYEVMIFHESADLDNLPNSQRNLLSSLHVRENLIQRGHVFLGVLDIDSATDRSDSWGPWMSMARKSKVPMVLIRPVGGGEITAHELPIDYDGLLDLLGDFE